MLLRDTAMKRIISEVALEFENDDIQSQAGPITFLKRQQSIMQAEAQLDQLKVPPTGRDKIMKEAMQKDLKKLDKNLRDICESSLPLIQEICDILPNKKSLRTEGVSEEVLAGSEIFSELQRLMAKFNQKILRWDIWVTFKMGVPFLQLTVWCADRSIMVAIIQLEDPDAEPLHWQCGVEETFGELLQKAFLPDPTRYTKGSDQEDEDESSDEEDDVIPDVWIKRWDPDRNCVTTTGQWWEHQPDNLKVRDVLSGIKMPENSAKRWVIEIVAKKGDYVVALVDDNGAERGKAVELPTSRKHLRCTTDRISQVFAGRKIARILELQGGKDASQKTFNRLSYKPKTNPLYVELEVEGGAPE
ncbi:hypothetical protein M408DRAFT_12331 [Serendipita vermifera MAFF 305830]|uniref:Uncharacterized protein n=1 Tax=Serendipita vermifera MAFF 305830 TaxID=933852 RepID=A0A0C2W635_SERVB|nr:hypothetical protein M408DRAFT_12331 [Serendipita vermifera MAFF 305830]